jgi:hypothetical protein
MTKTMRDMKTPCINKLTPHHHPRTLERAHAAAGIANSSFSASLRRQQPRHN